MIMCLTTLHSFYQCFPELMAPGSSGYYELNIVSLIVLNWFRIVIRVDMVNVVIRRLLETMGIDINWWDSHTLNILLVVKSL